MSIIVDWDDAEKTTILYTISGRWMWEEFHEAIKQGRNMMDSVTHQQVDSIVDMSRGHLLPQNALSNFSRMADHSHPKMGLMILAGTNTFVQALLTILTRSQNALAGKIAAAPNVAKAREMLAARRDSGALTAG